MENENMDQIQSQFGQVRIANEVVAIIVGLALNDIKGIYAADRRKAKKNLSKGIEIQVVDNEVICDIELAVLYGVKIPVLAEEIQTKVKNTVENMTGLAVQSVNLHILAVRNEKQEEEKDSEI